MPRRRLSDLLDAPAPGTSATPAPAPPGDAAKAPGRALVPTQAPAAPAAPAAAPLDGTAALAAELNDLTRTLDVLATVVTSVANRVDKQTEVLGQVNMTATEARQAAFHAKAQTDPKLFQKAVNAATQDTLQRLASVASTLAREQQDARQGNQAVQKELASLRTVLHAALRDDDERRKRRRLQLPLLTLGGLLLVLAMGLLLPRLAILHPNVCFAVGGEPQDYAEYGGGYDACFIRFRD